MFDRRSYLDTISALRADPDKLEEIIKMKENDRRHIPHSLRPVAAVAAALALFVALPNLSPTVAAAMVDVPVLGPLVEIVTFRNYTYDDGHSSADVAVPELGGSDAADQVNDQVQTYTDQLIARFKADCERIGEGYQGLDVSSTVVTDTDTWFTLRIDATETMASGYDFSRFYHIDKRSGARVQLSDLFPEGADYVVLQDRDGNPFCVVARGAGAVSCGCPPQAQGR